LFPKEKWAKVYNWDKKKNSCKMISNSEALTYAVRSPMPSNIQLLFLKQHNSAASKPLSDYVLISGFN
jgi:hypothetical protein